MSESRVVKKYSNRRLYDTELSRYVTVAELKQLIIAGVDLEVRDANTNNDITRHILLQIISEQESGGQPLFTTETLTRMIRFYGGAARQDFINYLEQSLGLFMEQQTSCEDELSDLLGKLSFDSKSSLLHQNLKIWRETQQNFLKSAELVPDQVGASLGTEEKNIGEAIAAAKRRKKDDK